MDASAKSRINIKKLELGKTFLETGTEFLENTTLHAYQYIVEPKRHWIEKFMWLIVQLVALTLAIYFVSLTWLNFTANPTFTTLLSQQYPIWKIPFPAISICNVNKISNAAATAYAEELLSKIPMNKDELRNRIRYLGRLYDFDIESREDMIWFQDILDKIDSNETTGYYDVKQRMQELAPRCEHVLVKCKWGGKAVNCSDIFERHRSTQGFCCMFNYVRNNSNSNSSQDVYTTNTTGPENGLVVVLNASVSDYFYPSKNFEGFEVHIFNSHDFPDLTSGTFYEESVRLSTEVFMRLAAATVQALPSVKGFSINQRGCLFPEELFNQFGGEYSYSECLLKCRIRSIIALCGCIPFFMPTNFPDGTTESVIKCTLQHITCLNRFRAKWRSNRPRGKNIRGLEEELEDSLNCPDCYPLCSSTTYRVQSSFSFIPNEDDERPYWGLLEDIPDITNLSVVRIYFPSSDSLLYKKDVILTWYEIVSTIGGMLGLCMGFSIISVIELVYFFTVRFYQNLFEKQNEKENQINENLKKKANIFKISQPPNYQDIELNLGTQFNDKKYYFLK